MLKKFFFISLTILCTTFLSVRSEDAKPQSYEDKRCRCVCPSPATVLNGTSSTDRLFYVNNVPINQCNCEYMILPHVADDIRERKQEFCPRCECKYENRNTTIIKVVVIIVIWVIMLLVVYMGFLICLDPLINKRAKAGSYQEHTNEDDENAVGTSQQVGSRGNVLNRVTHQQDKWKRQVREQRRNIYDRHTMLN